MAFATGDDVIAEVENVIRPTFSHLRDVQLPLLRLTYEEAMSRFGSDKPDMRLGMEVGK